MAEIQNLYPSLSQFGFETKGNFCFGTWADYAVSLRPLNVKNVYVDLAARLGKVPGGLRKALAASLKEKAGKGCSVFRLAPQTVTFSINFGKAADPADHFARMMNSIVAAMRENGIAPADSCVLTGAPLPDGLCLAQADGIVSFQPVSSAMLRSKMEKIRESVEENRENGSYATGVVGAVLGMLVGLIPNLLTILLSQRIYGILFALVPIASMFGYKLLKGKMSKASVVIVVVLSLLGAFLIPVIEITVALIQEYGISLADALGYTIDGLIHADLMKAVAGDLAQLLLFMAIGIVFAWRYMSSQVNSSVSAGAQMQLDSLRYNPLRGAEQNLNT